MTAATHRKWHSASDFVRRTNAMLSEFAQRVDKIASGMEAGGHHNLSEFEHRWDEVQSWLLAQVKRAQVSADSLLSRGQFNCVCGDLDGIRDSIDTALINAGVNAAEALLNLRQTCLCLRHRMLAA